VPVGDHHVLAKIGFGATRADLDLEYSWCTVFFAWARLEQGDELAGSGIANSTDDSAFEI
jgi:hypothetical protein